MKRVVHRGHAPHGSGRCLELELRRDWLPAVVGMPASGLVAARFGFVKTIAAARKPASLRQPRPERGRVRRRYVSNCSRCPGMGLPVLNSGTVMLHRGGSAIKCAPQNHPRDGLTH
jgi:hypothetical protein